MRVLLSPGAELAAGAAWAAALAGEDRQVVPLSSIAVRNLRRRLSQAEVHALRKALLGLGPGDQLEPPVTAPSGDGWTVGYVCAGRSAPGVGVPADDAGASHAALSQLLAVTDHANLTWRSPLTGANDDRLGPRFPVVAGLYRPEAVIARWEWAAGAPGPAWDDAGVDRSGPVATGVVADVRDEGRLSAFERAVVARHRFPVVSSELAAVAIVAAHLGLKLAAGVIVV